MKCVVNNVSSKAKWPLWQSFCEIKWRNLRGNLVQRTLPLPRYLIIIYYLFYFSIDEKPKFLRSSDDIIATEIHFLIYCVRQFHANRGVYLNLQRNARMPMLNTKRTYANARRHANCIRRAPGIVCRSIKIDCQLAFSLSLLALSVPHESIKFSPHDSRHRSKFYQCQEHSLCAAPLVRDNNQLNVKMWIEVVGKPLANCCDSTTKCNWN